MKNFKRILAGGTVVALLSFGLFSAIAGNNNQTAKKEVKKAKTCTNTVVGTTSKAALKLKQSKTKTVNSFKRVKQQSNNRKLIEVSQLSKR